LETGPAQDTRAEMQPQMQTVLSEKERKSGLVNPFPTWVRRSKTFWSQRLQWYHSRESRAFLRHQNWRQATKTSDKWYSFWRNWGIRERVSA